MIKYRVSTYWPFRNLLNWWTIRQLRRQAEPPTDKKLIYTDKLGNKFYTLRNPANIPAERALTAWVYTNDSEYGITRERLKWALDKLKTAINNQQPDLVTISQVIGALEACDSLYAEPEVLLNLASVYTTMNGEQFEHYADYEQKAKRQAWDKDPEAKSFFLQFAHQYSKRFSERPESNLQDYLKEIKPVLDQVSLSLSPPKKD